MFRRIVTGVVISTGALAVLAGCGSNGTQPIPTVTVTAPVTTPDTIVPALTVNDAVSLVRQQGSADIATWSDKALVLQFNDVCSKLDKDWSFNMVVLDMANRTIAPFTGADAGTVVTGAVLSTCQQYYSIISNL